MLVNRFAYRELQRVTQPNGVRHYVCPDTGAALPSVTTVIGATGDKTALREWKAWRGPDQAERDRDQAAKLGTLMHTHLECHVTDRPRPGGSHPMRVLAHRMADQIITKGLCQLGELWGSEVTLHLPGCYAGTSDLIGEYRGRPAIIDFKTTRRIKTCTDKIEGYYAQGAAYSLSHNHLFGTDITTVVIFMVARDLEFRQFVIEGADWTHWCGQWIGRYQQFLAQGGLATAAAYQV